MIADLFVCPRKSLQDMIKAGGLLPATLLVAMSGVLRQMLANTEIGAFVNNVDSIFSSLLGMVFGWIFVSAMIFFGSRLFGGIGSWKQTLIGTSFSMMPWLLSILALPLIVLATIGQASIAGAAALSTIKLLRMILSLWSLILLIVSTREIHRFDRAYPMVISGLSIIAVPLLLTLLLLLIAITLVIAVFSSA